MSRVVAPRYEALRLTIPAREALLAAGNLVEGDGVSPIGVPYYSVTLHRPPADIVSALIGHGAAQHRGLRLAEEPEYPGEWSRGGVAWYEHGSWVPCPTCGSALVWYEAGYVPGYRVCVARQHHVQLSGDGRSATAVRGRRGVSP